MHGGAQDLHRRRESIIIFVQQFCFPPGLLPHPFPPQLPQIGKQHTVLVHSIFGFDVFLGSTQGRASRPQRRPLSSMVLTQQPFLPPGLPPHPEPPHSPQLRRQHTFDVHTPFITGDEDGSFVFDLGLDLTADTLKMFLGRCKLLMPEFFKMISLSVIPSGRRSFAIQSLKWFFMSDGSFSVRK